MRQYHSDVGVIAEAGSADVGGRPNAPTRRPAHPATAGARAAAAAETKTRGETVAARHGVGGLHLMYTELTVFWEEKNNAPRVHRNKILYQ